MAITLKIAKTSQGLQPFNTYTKSSRQTVTFGRANVVNPSTYMDLTYMICWPIGIPAGTLVPVIVGGCPSGFQTTLDQSALMSSIESFVTCGAVVVIPKYRTVAVNPVNDNDGSSDTAKTKAIRAALSDMHDFFALLRKSSFLHTSDYNIDDRRILYFGSSSGGQLGILYCLTQPNFVAGMAGSACGMGLDAYATGYPSSSPNHTADLRAFGTEDDITLGSPPMMAFLTDNDQTIGGSWNIALATRLALDPASAPFRKADGSTAFDHDRIEDFGNVVYGGASVAPIEAIRRFFNDCMSGLNARPSSGVTFT